MRSSSLDQIFASVERSKTPIQRTKCPVVHREITLDQEKDVRLFCFRQQVRMILLVGPPIQARQDFIMNMKRQVKDMRYFAADDFFMKNGRYVFDAKCLLRAHQKCQGNVRGALMDSKCPIVVVDNTSVKKEHIKVYDDFKYPFAVIVFQPSTAADAIALGIGNTKNIPQHVFENCFNEMNGLRLNDKEFPMLRGVFHMSV